MARGRANQRWEDPHFCRRCQRGGAAMNGSEIYLTSSSKRPPTEAGGFLEQQTKHATKS